MIGDALRIRQFAARRQKNDRRDSELLLDLLLRGDFPAIHIPSIASQEVLRLLRYRHRLVGMRTMLKNGRQAVMLSNRVLRTARMRTLLWRHQLEKLPLTGADAVRREHSLPLMDELSARIDALENELQRRSQGDSAVALLQTHPGVGLLTALAVVHTLSPLSSLSPRSLCGCLLWSRPRRTLQWRDCSIRTHLKAREPPAAFSVDRSWTQCGATRR